MQTIRLLAVQEKYPDLQVHVRLVEADGVQFVDIRDYVPSSELYGRGVMLPSDRPLIQGIADALRDVQEGRVPA